MYIAVFFASFKQTWNKWINKYLKRGETEQNVVSSFHNVPDMFYSSIAHVSTSPFHAKSCSPKHVAYSSPNHAPVLPQLCHPDCDTSSQVLQVCWWRNIDLHLQVPPQEKVQWCKVRGPWGPLDGLAQCNNPTTKQLGETICHCSLSMARSAVLCPPQSLKSAISTTVPRYSIKGRDNFFIYHSYIGISIDIVIENDGSYDISVAHEASPNSDLGSAVTSLIIKFIRLMSTHTIGP